MARPPSGPVDLTLVTRLPIAACVCDASSAAIVACNAQAVALWGQTPKSADEVMHFVRPGAQPLTPAETPFLPPLLDGGPAIGVPAVVRRPDGVTVRVDVNIASLSEDATGRSYVLMIFHGARRRGDMLLRGQKRALEMIARADPLLAILHALATISDEQAGPAVKAAILLLEADGVRLRHGAAPSLPDSFNRAMDGIEIGPIVGTFGAAAYLREPVFTLDIEQSPNWARFKHLTTDLGLNAAWSMPIVASHGRVLGTFGHYFTERRGPTAAERETVEILAQTAAVAIERQYSEDSARGADRRKDEFLAMLAHELRSPLAPIRTAARLLSASPRDERVVARVQEVIERQVQSMSRLLDDLLDVSRITRGVVELRKRVVDVRELITQAIDTVASMAHSRGHDLVVSFAPGAAHVLVDPTRMEQAVVNLLTNAIRYTPRGGNLTITVTADGTNVLIRVVDNGRGIAPELLPYVFDMFTQGSRPLDRSEGGLGVGLTVARRLVDMHGGDIEARSDGLGCGSTFTITLPQVAVAPGTDSTPPRGKRAVRARRILIVEDQPDAAEMLALFLEGQSHAVRVVEDGHAALVETAAYKPDIILIDIGLPGMSGYDLAERLRSDRTQPQPLLVAITGYGQDEDRARSLAVGFDHHLVKPIDPDILTELMAEPASPELPR